MNFKEGSRRIGVILGIAGALAGVYLTKHSWAVLFSYQSQYQEWKRIEAMPVVQNALAQATKKEWDKSQSSIEYIEINRDGVQTVAINLDSKTLFSVHLLNEPLSTYSMEPLSLENLWSWELAEMLIYPLVGFLIPWAAVRIMAWVGSGFTAK